jgi:hypothetical protein
MKHPQVGDPRIWLFLKEKRHLVSARQRMIQYQVTFHPLGTLHHLLTFRSLWM